MTPKKYASLSDYVNNTFSDKLFLFQYEQVNQSPTMSNSRGDKMHYPPKFNFFIVNDEIYDSKKGVRREIGYKQGVSSLYIEEWQDNDLTRKRYKVEFLDGKCILEGSNPLLIHYMMLSNYNGSNANRDTTKTAIFRFVDHQNNYNTAIERDKKEQEAASWCYDAPFEEVASYARIKMGATAMNLDSESIRWNMRNIARDNPVKFLKDKDNPLTKRKQIIFTAIDKGLLKVNPNSISWTDNPNQPLNSAPNGIDVIDHFVQATLTPEGEIIFAAIKEQIKPEIKGAAILNTVLPEFKKKVVEREPTINVNEDSFKELQRILDKAIENEVVKVSGIWHSYKKWKSQGRLSFVKEMKGDAELLNGIKSEVGEI